MITLSRKEKLLAPIRRDGSLGLEIGPSINPIAPKSEGFAVTTVDWQDQAGLIERYRKLGVDTSAIEPVDLVWSGQSYAELTGKRKHFDWIIASHVIEHVPDLIAFINQCDEVLRDGGVLSLAVPDKRTCFDRFRPISGLGNVIDGHLQGRRRNSPGTVAEFFMYAATRNGLGVWGDPGPGTFGFSHTADQARSAMQSLIDADTYVDTHAWCFVPSSFRLLIEDLRALGLIELRETGFFPSEGCEFFVALSRDGAGPGLGRLELMHAIDRELAEVLPRG
jgi:SAM-dependent methyltransferase